MERSFEYRLEGSGDALSLAINREGIVRAVMNLGSSLGKRVVAEGIETPEQLDMLRGLGVHVGQGYLLARPLRADQVAQAVAESTALAAA